MKPEAAHESFETNALSTGVISTNTTELLSMSDSSPNAALSIGYSCESNRVATSSRSTSLKPPAGDASSVKIARWLFTTLAVALTVAYVEHVIVAHTLNDRLSPGAGGAATGGRAATCARPAALAGAVPYERACSERRKN